MGYEVVSTNTIIDGVEIDIVCYDYISDEVVFIEVKTTALESRFATRVRRGQRHRISKATQVMSRSWNVRVEHMEVRINPEDSD